MRMRPVLRSAALLLGVLSVASCSWSRFSDLQNNAPNVVLKRPKDLKHGFGDGVASASLLVTDPNSGKQTLQVRLLATGTPGQQGGAVFNLGSSDQPDLDAVDSTHCDGSYCQLAVQPAGMPLGGSVAGDLQLCFVSGLMKAHVLDSHQYQAGLAIRCDNGADYSLEAPTGVKNSIITPAFDDKLGYDPPALVVAADHSGHPTLVAGARLDKGQTVVRSAWFYPPGAPAADDTQVLTPPGSSLDAGYATAVAAGHLDGGGTLIAVGAPGPSEGHVWLFRLDKSATTAKAIGCLGGPPGFGRTLATGIVDRDQSEDLVVADNDKVSVFSGKVLGGLKQASAACSLASLPAGALIASFGCGQTPAITGCSKSQFGASLAVGDLDGNGDGEVIVGAPAMTVRGVSDAGALLVYDVSSAHPQELTEADFISSAETGDRLGTSVTTARIGNNRDIIAAGAPGHQKVALFYCSKLLPADKRGARCR